jgi:hypothetical protein
MNEETGQKEFVEFIEFVEFVAFGTGRDLWRLMETL